MVRTADPASLSSHEVDSAVRGAVQWVASRLPLQRPETVAEDAEYAAWMLSAAVEHHRESAISAVADAASDVYAPAAAAMADALGLTAPAIGTALARAQFADSAHTHWTVVRALQRMAMRRARRATGPPGPVIPGEDGSRLHLPPGVHVLRRPAPAAGIRTALVDPASTPFRAALAIDPTLGDKVAADPRWGRLVLCLYGGARVGDLPDGRARIAALRVRMAARMAVSERHRLAALADGCWARLPVDVGDALDLDAITVDSPLTPMILEWLRDDALPTDAADRLRRLAADDGVDADLRADAVVARLAIADLPWEDDELLSSTADEPVRNRVLWRLERVRILLSDAVGALTPGAVYNAFRTRRPTAPEQLAISVAVVRALATVERRRSGWGEHIEDGLPLSLLELVNTQQENSYLLTSDTPSYNVAVALDTVGAALVHGRGAGLADVLSKMSVTAAAGGGERWPLDPLAPAAGHPVAESLTVLARLDPELAFVRCWMIDRLAGQVVRQGFLVEAACLVLRDRAVDPVSAERSLRVLAAAAAMPALLEASTADTVVMLASLPAPEGFSKQSYPQGRARIRLAHLCGQRLSAADLSSLAEQVEEPDEALRLLELALELRVARADERTLVAMTALSERIVSPTERARARARLARFTAGDPLDDRAGTAAEVPDHEMALLLGSLPTPIEPSRAARHAALVAGLGSAEARAVARGRSAEPLLVHERRHRRPWEPSTPLGFPWALTTALAVCGDALDALGPSVPEPASTAAAWSALPDPAREEAALAVLLRTGRTRPLDLDGTACEVVERLLATGRIEPVRWLLPLARLRQRSALVAGWRGFAVTDIADLATLLTLESGDLDEAAVDCLPRLVIHDDEYVRFRVWAVFSQVSSPFRMGTVGAPVVAGLARLAAANHDRPVRRFLRAALSAIVYDAPDALSAVLTELSEDTRSRSLLLRSVRRLTPLSARGVDTLLRRVDGPERRYLLSALVEVAASQAGRAGRSDLQVFVPVLRDLARNDLGDAATIALELFGLCAPPTVARDLCVEAGVDAVRALGHLLDRADLEPADRAIVVTTLTTSAAREDAHGVRAAYELERSGVRAMGPLSDPVAWLTTFLRMDRPGAREVSLIDEAAWVARFITAQASRERLLDVLMRAVVEDTGRGRAAFVSTTGTGIVAVLALGEIALLAPELVRSAAGRAPACVRALRSLPTDAAGDSAHPGAIRALTAIGEDMGALLAMAKDSPAAIDTLIEAVARLDHLGDAAVAALVDGVRNDDRRIRALAGRTLQTACDHGLLADPDRAQRLAEILFDAARRPGADVPVLLEDAHAPLPIGSLAMLCRTTALHLLNIDRPGPDIVGEVVTPYPDGFRLLLPEGAFETGVPHQSEVLAETHGWTETNALTTALRGAAAWAAQSRTPLIDVLESLTATDGQ
ncbi:hypothetical protein [Embleya sp. NBC_00896]|uniref:hypothetical protein n=1 Tax=Embleya sp. NBC_00896 TaxID=2975961 RepID=UPI00386CD7AD|nr:hypothetical protein OG928_46305 [Embleya sp. NBC_00896]